MLPECHIQFQWSCVIKLACKLPKFHRTHSRNTCAVCCRGKKICEQILATIWIKMYEPFTILGTTKTSATWTDAQSRFASVNLDGVLGPLSIVRQTWWCPWRKQCRHWGSETVELLGGIEEKIVSPRGIINLPGGQINYFSTVCLPDIWLRAPFL